MTTPNILLLVMDTARAKTVLPAIQDGTLPNLAEFSENATTFTNAITVAPWTLPSHASIFTGQYTSTHQTDAKTPQFRPDVDPLANQLANAGYRTGGISANPWVSPEFGFDEGFDDFSMKWDADWDRVDVTAAVNSESTVEGLITVFKQTPLRRHPQLIRSLWNKKFGETPSDDGARLITSRASQWIENQSNRDSPFFLFLNYLEPHLPYSPPDEFSKKYLSDEDLNIAGDIDQDPWRYIAGQVAHSDEDFRLLKKLYLAEITYLDSQLGKLFEKLREAGIYNETAIFIIGDHGENIGEHGLMDHQYCLYDTLINVPLIVKHPQLDSGVTDERPVESRDLYPTILQLASIPTNPLPDSTSQKTLTDHTREYAVSEYLTPQPAIETLLERVDDEAELGQFDRALRTIRGKDWKYIESSDGTDSLYQISADPSEQNNVREDEFKKADKLSNRLSEIAGKLVKADSERERINEQSRERLEELGYLQ